MCVACVAQGIVYVGGAVGTLRVMAARAEHKRHVAREAGPTEAAAAGAAVEPASS